MIKDKTIHVFEYITHDAQYNLKKFTHSVLQSCWHTLH